MAIGLPRIARLAVDGVIEAIYTKWSLKVTQSLNLSKKTALQTEIKKKLDDDREKYSTQRPLATQVVKQSKINAQKENERTIKIPEDNVRMGAVQTFRKIADEHLAAKEERKEEKDQASSILHNRYTMLRTDAPCMLEAPSEFNPQIMPTSCLIQEMSNEELTEEKNVKDFATIDDITLRAALIKVKKEDQFDHMKGSIKVHIMEGYFSLRRQLQGEADKIK